VTVGKTRILILHHKERTWATYLEQYSSLATLKSAGSITVEVESMPQQNRHQSFAELPESVRRLLFFAKPDLLVCMDDGVKPLQPVFAFDVTEHVAATDHWMQRFPNLVGCAQEGVPGAFVAPGDMPNRPKFPGTTDPAFYFAYDRVIEIHQTPIYIAEWPSADGKNLDGDTSYPDLPPHNAPDIALALQFFDHVLDARMKGREVSSLTRDRLIVDLRHRLRSIGYKTIPEISMYGQLTANMPNGRPLDSKKFKKWLKDKGLKLPSDLPDRISKRDSYVIYRPQVKIKDRDERRKSLLNRISKRGGDPYWQKTLVYDYLFCRLGPTPLERDSNLVVDLSVLDFADFAEYVKKVWEDSPLQHDDFSKVKEKIPVYTLHLGSGLAQVMKNFVRITAYEADLIIFNDGLLYF
jgi:hypothetical protein